MKNKLLSILLCIMISLNNFIFVNASTFNVVENIPDIKKNQYLKSQINSTILKFADSTSFYDYISMTSIGFKIYDNTAECTLSLVGYPEVKKISSYIYLQRYVLGKWITISKGSFHQEENSSDTFFAPTKKLDTIGTYRFLTSIFVYANDGSVKLVELASNTDVY